MTGPMQKFGHRDSTYARPTQKWQCAHAQACKSGPNEYGQCPLRDMPCTPILSIKARKRNVAMWIFAAFFALCVVFFAGNSLLNTLSPGPLSANHSEVASCQDCHAAASETKLKWLHKAATLNSHNDDTKCLSCHKLGDNAFSPHSTAAANFSKKLETNAPTEFFGSWKVNSASLLRSWDAKDSDDVSCAVCHREHKGSFSPLDGFDPQQCHVCHDVKFSNLESEHPPYSRFPHIRPTRIKFDHVAHLDKHFYEDDYFDIAPEGCKQCHDTDQSGEWMLSNTFEKTCSDCHLQEIMGDSRANAKGVAVLSIPELDVASLSAAGYNIGEWPAWADGNVMPIMRLLLPPSLQNSVALQRKSLDLYDLTLASPEELRSVAELAWGIKQLYYDIQMGGTQLMNQRIASGLNEQMDQPTLNRLVASLPKDTLINNQLQWFPNLVDEVISYRKGEIKLFKKPIPLDAPSDADLVSSADAGNALGSQDIELGGNLDDISLDDDALDLNDDIDLGGDDIDLSDDIDLGSDDIDLSNDIDLGGDDSHLSDDDISLEGNTIDFGDDDISLDDDALSFEEVEKPSSVIPVNDNEEWAYTGGWYRDGGNIRYRPVDHADPFFKAWLDVSSTQDDPMNTDLFASLSAEDSVGNCIKCHSFEPKAANSAADTNGNLQYKIHWDGFKPSDVVVDFNRFSHTSHFSLMTDDGCSSCHLLNSDATDDSPEALASFVDMDRETCTQCHQQGRAPDNCLTCHNYHVEPLAPAIEQISDSLKGDDSDE